MWIAVESLPGHHAHMISVSCREASGRSLNRALLLGSCTRSIYLQSDLDDRDSLISSLPVPSVLAAKEKLADKFVTVGHRRIGVRDSRSPQAYQSRRRLQSQILLEF